MESLSALQRFQIPRSTNLTNCSRSLKSALLAMSHLKRRWKKRVRLSLYVLPFALRTNSTTPVYALPNVLRTGTRPTVSHPVHCSLIAIKFARVAVVQRPTYKTLAGVSVLLTALISNNRKMVTIYAAPVHVRNIFRLSMHLTSARLLVR